jgi:hypothetical protein
MNALDLTKRPPRTPREPLADLDLIMAARSVDKICATLPGGNLGDYQIQGFSARMFETLELDEEDFRSMVALAPSDAEVAAWIRKHVPQAKIDAFNQSIGALTIADRIDNEHWRARYAFALTLPPETPLVDVLALDDERSFR